MSSIKLFSFDFFIYFVIFKEQGKWQNKHKYFKVEKGIFFFTSALVIIHIDHGFPVKNLKVILVAN